MRAIGSQTVVLAAALALSFAVLAYLFGMVGIGPAMIIAIAAFLIAFEVDSRIKRKRISKGAGDV